MSKHSKIQFTRREFITSTLFLSIATKSFSKSQETKNHWDKFEMYEDEKTGAKIYRIISGPSKNTTIYQTHPMWGKAGKHFYFMSDRSDGNMRLHCLDITTKEIYPILERDIGNFTLSWNTERVYFFNEDRVFKQDPSGERMDIGSFPEEFGSIVGGIGIDSNEKWLYCGTHKDNEEQYVLRRLKISDGTWEECVSVSFKIGHVQPNPWNTDLVMFCWETSGDSLQRTWCWSEKTRKAEPFFVEHDELWVTHEVWWDKQCALFTLWPYDEQHKKLPHGIAETDRERGQKGIINLLTQYPAWHTHGSHNHKWVLGDDFNRNIWLISPKSKERRLLISGKKGKNINVHPHASFTPDSSGIVFNCSRFGYEEIHLVLLPKQYKVLPLP